MPSGFTDTVHCKQPKKARLIWTMVANISQGIWAIIRRYMWDLEKADMDFAGIIWDGK